MIVLTNNTLSDRYRLTYKSTKTIHETEVLVSVNEGQFNYSQNPSAVDVTLNNSYDFTTTAVFNVFPSQTKKIFKVYITYKGDANALTGTYGVNGDTSPTEAMTNSETSDATLENAGTTDHNIATFTLNSHPADVKSIMFKFTGACGTDFEINDISILYRLRPIK